MPDADIIREARELCERATPGEWRAGLYGSVCTSNGFKLCNVEPESNTRFIARSRTLIPEMLDLLAAKDAEIARLTAERDAAVDAIRKSLCDKGNSRPTLDRCSQCAKFIKDDKQRKYKFGCESLCPDALKVMVECGFKDYEVLIPFAEDWRGAGEG